MEHWNWNWNHCSQKTNVLLNLVEKYVRLKWKKKKVNVLSFNYIYHYWIYLNITKETRFWICLGSLGPLYVKILKMAMFWISQNLSWQSSEYISEYISEYAAILSMQELPRVLNMPQYDWICLNRMWICLNMSEFTIIDMLLNMYHIIHRVKLFHKLISTYWEIAISRTWSKI